MCAAREAINLILYDVKVVCLRDFLSGIIQHTTQRGLFGLTGAQWERLNEWPRPHSEQPGQVAPSRQLALQEHN